MLELSLSRLGLGPVAASPWLLLLLVGASWILARVLAWTYTLYNNSRRLRCFLQPPKHNWFLGHMDLVSVGSRMDLGDQGGWTSCGQEWGSGWGSGLGQQRSKGSQGAPSSSLTHSSALPSRPSPHPVFPALACFGVHFLPALHTLVHL